MTKEERTLYTKIKKQAMKEILLPEYIPNRSGTYWILDYGIYHVFILVEPCDLGGVFVEQFVSFFWNIRDEGIVFDWALGDSTRVTTPDVPTIAEALLYQNEWVFRGPYGQPITADTKIVSTPEDFEAYFRILVRTAREKGLAFHWHGDYKRLQRMLLDIRYTQDNAAMARDQKTMDIAIVSILAGEVETGRKLLQEVIEKQVFLRALAQTLLERSGDRKQFQDFIRQKVIAGRSFRQKRFSKLPIEIGFTNPNG